MKSPPLLFISKSYALNYKMQKEVIFSHDLKKLW